MSKKNIFIIISGVTVLLSGFYYANLNKNKTQETSEIVLMKDVGDKELYAGNNFTDSEKKELANALEVETAEEFEVSKEQLDEAKRYLDRHIEWNLRKCKKENKHTGICAEINPEKKAV